MKVTLKNQREVATMAEGGHILAEILKKIAAAAQPGTQTVELDALANDLCQQHKAQPAFLGYQGYPATLCTSLNSTIVHGIPGNDTLEKGDVLGLDMGIKYKGFYTDMAMTIGIGAIAKNETKLINATREALDRAIAFIKPGVTLGDVGYLISQIASQYNLGVVRDLTGHGIGRHLQEEPSVPNYGVKGQGLTLKEGMTLAIEPMFVLGQPDVRTHRNNWSVLTTDNSIGAHFEHTVVVTKTGTQILTR
jgi:methionyl aminopeptidase